RMLNCPRLPQKRKLPPSRRWQRMPLRKPRRPRHSNVLRTRPWRTTEARLQRLMRRMNLVPGRDQERAASPEHAVRERVGDRTTGGARTRAGCAARDVAAGNTAENSLATPAWFASASACDGRAESVAAHI